jgi:hypothetical protein
VGIGTCIAVSVRDGNHFSVALLTQTHLRPQNGARDASVHLGPVVLRALRRILLLLVSNLNERLLPDRHNHVLGLLL